MTYSMTARPGNTLMPFVTAEQLAEVITPTGAINALRETIAAGLDPEADAQRTRVTTSRGSFLQMPSTWHDAVGVKLLTITESNAAKNLPVIQGVYVLFGGETQQPVAFIDGIALTNLRTPAVSALGAGLAKRAGALQLCVFGTGVQAWAHICTFVEAFEVCAITIVGRSPERSAALAQRVRTKFGITCHEGSATDVAQADMVLCCTAAEEPLFDGALVADQAVVVAMGSHESSRREVDDVLLNRSNIMVESRSSALREAGDVIQGLASGAIPESAALMTLSEVISGTAVLREDRPTVFKTTGMPWQDLVIARSVLEALNVSGNGTSESSLSTV